VVLQMQKLLAKELARVLRNHEHHTFALLSELARPPLPELVRLCGLNYVLPPPAQISPVVVSEESVEVQVGTIRIARLAAVQSGDVEKIRMAAERHNGDDPAPPAEYGAIFVNPNREKVWEPPMLAEILTNLGQASCLADRHAVVLWCAPRVAPKCLLLQTCHIHRTGVSESLQYKRPIQTCRIRVTWLTRKLVSFGDLPFYEFIVCL
jgi:hypothetical protein